MDQESREYGAGNVTGYVALTAPNDVVSDMTGTVTTTCRGALPTTAMAALAQAEDYVRASRAEATQRAYRADWSHFEGWCRGHGFDPLPAAPVVVGAYLAAHATILAPATLTRRLSAVAVAHRLGGHHLDTRHPAIRDVLGGIRRVRGTAQRRAAPATTTVVQSMAAACNPNTIMGLRDRALVLTGFAAALRRSELVSLRVEDMHEEAEGLRLMIRRSKSDQEGAGEVVGIARTGTATCPVAALRMWLNRAGITEGAIFRAVDRHGRVATSALDDRAVARIIQKLAGAIGLDATMFSGHSLRAGFATAAAAAGIEERRIARQTRHRSSAVLRLYIRDGDLFRNNASREVGL